MLTDEQKYANKLQYLELLANCGIDLTKFSLYLDCDRMDFFNKPYNTYDTGAYAGALCEHSLLLYKELKKLCELYLPEKYTEQDIILVALLKDLYRGELFEMYTKNQKNDATGQWEQVLAYKNKEVRPVFGDIGFSSYMIARKFFDLNNDEIVEAICQSGNGGVDSYYIKQNYKLVTLTTMAELAVMYLQGE